MTIILAATNHDPDGRLYDQTKRLLAILNQIFDALAVRVSHATQERSLELLVNAGAHTCREQADQPASMMQLGRSRRAALALALELNRPYILFCDFDRILHWAEYYPDELAHITAYLQHNQADFTVLGRTERAFASHPQLQRHTEEIVNSVFAAVSGRWWDVTAAARGLTRRAAAAILERCPDESIGTDVSWPLFLQRAGGFTLDYIAAEGLEFETADRYPEEVAAAGGLARWVAQLDMNPRAWAQRLELARVEVEALLPYVEEPHA